MSQSHRKILFLKTLDEDLASIHPSNALLLSTLRAQGFTIDERSWLLDKSLTATTICTYSAVTLIACYEYNNHISLFEKFMKEVVTPAARENGLRVVNSPEVLSWNCNKVYLKDLQQDLGITIPSTIFVDTAPGDVPLFNNVIRQYQDGDRTRTDKFTHGAMVVKPSVSASARETYKIPASDFEAYDSDKVQKDWERTYTYTRSLSPDAKVMIQGFEAAIGRGEYSVIFLGGEYSHTMLKKPGEGEFVAIEEQGGTVRVVPDEMVPAEGKEIGRKVVEYVEKKFGVGLGYLRLDGVVRDDGRFVVIEAEMFEPYVYFDAKGASEGLMRFCKVLTE
ncbi:hypothetical protein TWF694_000438 [Orbilia ellipsospora]|uniref:ATP-grasp domain-containing protein n=1 Tax=Orbilia ellipsospora TaxID=2528407 RepID=A0AAV9XNY1_9PEZI